MKTYYFTLILFIVLAQTLPAQITVRKTYCNPIDINYPYIFKRFNGHSSYRSIEDPVILNHNGAYYLFVIPSGAYWHSKDLINWDYIALPKSPPENASDSILLATRDTLLLLQASQTTYKDSIMIDPIQHGWERLSGSQKDTILQNTEGVRRTEFAGRYYLQYGIHSTDYQAHANGVYVATDSLGPYTYAPYNPVVYKPSGFLKGAGHGNIFKDSFGNYWQTVTPSMDINWHLERRISLFPTGFDFDGQMYSDTRFGDFPHYLPTHKWGNKDDLFMGWMLLSYKKPCGASSVRDTFRASRATDENFRTFWVAKENKTGEWLTVDLEREHEVRAIQINFMDYKSDISARDTAIFTQFKILHSLDGKTWETMIDASKETTDRSNPYFELEKSIRTRFIRYEHVYSRTPYLAISDMRVFGTGFGKKSEIPQGLTVIRDASDDRNVGISWSKVPNAVGYNILWGIDPNKLNQTVQVWDDEPNNIELRALNIGQKYYYAIEAFNENGVSMKSSVISDK